MSFFDDSMQPSEPRRSRRPPSAHDQSLTTRRLVGAGAAVLVLLLLILGVRGCLGARKDRAFKSYVASVAELTGESDSIDQRFFALLSRPGKATPLDLQNETNTFRASAEQLVVRAEKIGWPDELGAAQRWLVVTLQLRRDGLQGVAREIPTAFAQRDRQVAFERIAGQMQNFLASDVIYSQRFVPDVIRELDGRKLADEVKVPETRSIADINWLLPETVASRLSAVRGGKAATPGTHGLGLLDVTAQPSGTVLTQDAPVTLKASSKLSFDVQVQNQGENEETDVTVTLKLSGTTPLNLEQTIPRIAAGDAASVTIPLTAQPAPGAATLSIAARPVPGEKLTDNNKGTYEITFGS